MAAPGLNCSMQTLSCDTWDRVPRPGIKPGPPVLGAWSRNHWTTREIPAWCFFNMSCSRKKKHHLSDHFAMSTCQSLHAWGLFPPRPQLRSILWKGSGFPGCPLSSDSSPSLGWGLPSGYGWGFAQAPHPVLCVREQPPCTPWAHTSVCLVTRVLGTQTVCLVWVRLLWALRQPLHVWDSLLRMEAKSSSLEPSLLSSSSILRVTAPHPPPQLLWAVAVS